MSGFRQSMSLSMAVVALSAAAFTEIPVRFHGNGGMPDLQTHVYYQDGSRYVYGFFPPAERLGYDFVDWRTADGKSVGEQEPITTTLKDLYATWTASPYNVVFDPAGADQTNAVKQTFTYDVVQALRPCSFTRVGYVFLGWTPFEGGLDPVYGDGEAVVNLTDSGTTKLHAVWRANDYRIIFNANGSDVKGLMADMPTQYGMGTVLPGCGFSRTGYAFTGWSSNPTGDVVWAGAATVSNLTAEVNGVVDIYAVWRGLERPVTFDPGRPEATIVTTNYLGDAFGVLPNPGTKDGFWFAGWWYRSEASNRWFQALGDMLVPEEFYGTNMILQARWEPDAPELVTNVVREYTGANSGYLRFDWRTACDDFYVIDGKTNYTEYLELLVNGVRRRVLCGRQDDFVPESYQMGSSLGIELGNNTYIWRRVVKKSTLQDVGETCGCVENIHWTEIPAGPVHVSKTEYTNVPNVSVEIMYQSNDGTGFCARRWHTVTNGVLSDIVDLPQREGWFCSGWYTEPSTGRRVTAEASIEDLDWNYQVITNDVISSSSYEENGTNYTVYVRPVSRNVTNDVCFYAHWVEDARQVTFDANGGERTMTGVVVDKGEPVTLPQNNFTRFGCVFRGWTTNACEVGTNWEPEDIAFADGETLASVTNDVALYAAWEWIPATRMPSPTEAYTTNRVDSLQTNGYGVLSFDWCSEGESELVVSGKVVRVDGLAFCTNGVEMFWLGGDSDWRSVVVTNLVEEGTNEYCWTFTHDLEGLCSNACGQVSNVVWTPFADVTFHDGDTVFQVNRYLEGETFGDRLPGKPDRPGRSFLGWFLDPADTNAAQVTAADVVTNGFPRVYARWGGAVVYTFDALGGGQTLSAISNEVLTVGGSCTNLPSPAACPGQVFVGWSYERENGEVVQLADGDPLPAWETESTNDVPLVLTARWKSENPGPGSTNDMESCTYCGPGVLSFTWTTSCEGRWIADGVTNLADYLELLVDGRRAAVFDGIHTNPVEYAYTNLVAGDCVYSWRYVKDGDVDMGEDSVRITNLRWHAFVEVAFHRNDSNDVVYTNRFYLEEKPYSDFPSIEGGKPGYNRFDGWWTSPAGGTRLEETNVVDRATVHAYAHWSANDYVVRYAANGGVGSMADEVCIYGVPHTLAANAFSRKGCVFAGWALSSTGGAVYGDGANVKNLTVMNGGVVTLHAVWASALRNDEAFWTTGEAGFTGASKETWDGWIADGAHHVAGVAQFKTAKMKKGTVKVSASLTLLGKGRKTTVSGTGTVRDGLLRLTIASGKLPDVLTASFGVDGCLGQMGDYSIYGGRNLWASKDFRCAALDDRFRNMVRSFALASANASGPSADLANGLAGLSVAVKSKGSVKISGYLADGTKVSVSTRLIAGESVCAIPVLAPLYSKKGGFGCLLKFTETECFVDHLSRWQALKSKTPFIADLVPVGGVDVPACPGTTAEAVVDDCSDSIRVRCTTKTGLFKGSYKTESPETGRTVRSNIHGVFVGGVGYGSSVIKNVRAIQVEAK